MPLEEFTLTTFSTFCIHPQLNSSDSHRHQGTNLSHPNRFRANAQKGKKRQLATGSTAYPPSNEARRTQPVSMETRNSTV